MTQAEILERAIQKARSNGYVGSVGSDFVLAMGGETPGVVEAMASGIIFNHDFAKALWGDVDLCLHCATAHQRRAECDFGTWPMSSIPVWQYHLQQMVLAPDPIKYLGEHMPE